MLKKLQTKSVESCIHVQKTAAGTQRLVWMEQEWEGGGGQPPEEAAGEGLWAHQLLMVPGLAAHEDPGWSVCCFPEHPNWETQRWARLKKLTTLQLLDGMKGADTKSGHCHQPKKKPDVGRTSHRWLSLSYLQKSLNQTTWELTSGCLNALIWVYTLPGACRHQCMGTRVWVWVKFVLFFK